MINHVDFNRICAAAQNQKPVIGSFVSTAKGPLSFGIVNSASNGKRLSFSKALTSALGLGEDIALITVPSEGVIMIARELPYEGAIRGKLRGEDKKLWYASPVVQLITEQFGIDFKKHVSYSYSDISINDLDGIPVATVCIAPAAGSAGEESA